MIFCILADGLDIIASSLTLPATLADSVLVEGQRVPFTNVFDIVLMGSRVLSAGLWTHFDIMIILSSDTIYDDRDLVTPYAPVSCIRQQLSAAYTDPSTTVTIQDFGASFCQFFILII